MSRSLLALAIALPLALSAAPAAAATWAFGGSGGNFASVTSTTVGISFITAEARRFDASLAPNGLTHLSQLTALSSTNTAMTVNRSTPGIGITGGASSPQIDTNFATQREAMLLTSNAPISLRQLQLSYIDRNDTLQIYGVNRNGTLTALGFGGDIISGLGGAATFTNTSANDGTTVLTFANTQLAYFNRYVFTTREPGDIIYGGDRGQGYRIDSISGEALPEPGSWALMITGFGLIGAVMRRQRRAALT
jgi:hypothetical protein